MHGSYRRYFFAALGVLGAGLLYASYKLYDAAQQQRADYHYQPARERGRLVVLPGKADPKGYQPNCDNPQGDSNADLCAQWAAVDQVMESNRLASVNVRLSLFVSLLTLLGTVFVGWTLLETRNTSRRELRAYVFADSVGVYLLKSQTPRSENGKVGSTIVIRNSGQTPAYDVVHWCSLVCHPIHREEELVIPLITDVVKTNLPPGGAMHANRRIIAHLTRHDQQEMREGRSALYVFGRIVYRDAFNRMQHTIYRFAYAGWPLPEGLSMNFALKGNQAT